MAEHSKIQWTTHTFNPWRGCTKVSEGCAHCYAETLSKRNPAVLGEWGAGKPRVLASEAMWKQPLKWNKAAGNTRVLAGETFVGWADCTSGIDTPNPTKSVLADGLRGPTSFNPEVWESMERVRPRVFCASLADWLDDEVPIEWLIRLMALIVATPNLDWLLLTKRPQNLRPRMEQVMRDIPRNNITFAESSARCLAEAWLTTGGTIIQNIWFGVTVENQKRADERIPLLLSIPAKVRFLSCEPLLGPVNLVQAGAVWSDLNGNVTPSFQQTRAHVNWVICGGESGGPKARPMHPDWARSLRDQCKAAGVPFFFKQWGEYQYFDASEYRTSVTKDTKISADLKTGFQRVGKAKAGRLLDGIEHNGFPNLEGRDAR